MGVIPWAPQLQNGDVAAKALMVDFDGLGHYLQPAAAASLRAFADAFESVFGVAFTISEAFRDLPTQYFYYDLYIDGDGNMAAVPGTSSHGQGLAVDINSWVYGNGDTDRHRWLVENAPRFGWSWELVGKPSGERWHFNYVGSWTAADFTPDKTPEQLEEEELMSAAGDILAAIAGVATAVGDVKQWVLNVFAKKQWAIIKDAGTGVIYAVAPGNVVRVPTVDHLVLGRRRGIFPEGELELPSNEADFFIAFYETSEQNDNAALALLAKLSVEQVRQLNADAGYPAA